MRPENVTEKHLEFLDELRQSGETNMLGAAPYVELEFDVGRYEAGQIVNYWIKSFGDDNR